jgi:hypothetical protein
MLKKVTCKNCPHGFVFQKSKICTVTTHKVDILRQIAPEAIMEINRHLPVSTDGVDKIPIATP